MSINRNKRFSGLSLFSSLIISGFLWVSCSSQTVSEVSNTSELAAKRQDCNSANTPPPTPADWSGNELHKAVMSLKPSAVKNALKQKINVNEKDSFGNTPLHLALSRKISEPTSKTPDQLRNRAKKEAAVQLEIAKLLLKNGADVNAKGFAGETPLLNAIILDESIAPQIINLLIAAKANYDAQDNLGVTPLMEAARTNRSSIIKILLDKGANKNLKNCEAKTALMIAEENGFAKSAQMLK